LLWAEDSIFDGPRSTIRIFADKVEIDGVTYRGDIGSILDQHYGDKSPVAVLSVAPDTPLERLADVSNAITSRGGRIGFLSGPLPK